MADLTRVRVWADALIQLHLDPTRWTFDFDNAKRRAGQCNYSKHRITVSRYLAPRFDDDEMYQILLHEVAHALAGPGAGHGPRWKSIARELGYEGGRTHTGEIAHEYATWVGRCPAGHEHVRFRRPTRSVSCGRCSRGYSDEHRIVWRDRRSGSEVAVT